MNENSVLTLAGPVASEANRDKAQRLAAGLSKLGIVAGDCIALVTADEIEQVDAMIACSLLGAVFVSLDPRASTDELAEELAGFACTGVIAADYALAPIVALREHIETLRWVVGISTAHGKSTPAQLQARGVRPYAELAATDLIIKTA
jgi:acyl-CoA synthetase (AMP-forming)/AMP-acid ligase II